MELSPRPSEGVKTHVEEDDRVQLLTETVPCLTQWSLTSKCYNILKRVTEGGTVFDGFLLAASQEVGQVILTLPYIFSLLGMASGIIFQLFFASLALYTNYLLMALHTEYRHIINTDPKHLKHGDKNHIVSYYEIVSYLVGPRAGMFAQTIVYVALIGLSTVQIISTSSNSYILNDTWSKRDWSILWGALFMFMLFIPSFRHYRMMSVIGILSTTYTAWFMTIEAATLSPVEGVTHTAPANIKDYARGFTSLLFTFAGHSSNIEVADVMNDQKTYARSYFFSYLYVFTLTMPNAASVYHRFGDDCLDNANAFSLFERTTQRDIGIVLMCLHEMVAFGLFSGPLYHLWEKYTGCYDKPFHIKIFYRAPLAGAIVLFAIAFPFYGSVGSLLGAFTSSFATYIIPLSAYSYAFRSQESQDKMQIPPPSWVNISYMLRFNWFAAGVLFICGVCIGGYSAMDNFVNKVHEFKFFADCYECD